MFIANMNESMLHSIVRSSNGGSRNASETYIKVKVVKGMLAEDHAEEMQCVFCR